MIIIKTFLIISILFFYFSSIYAQLVCPYGQINCRGQCGLFIDEDKDGYCDLTIRVFEDTLNPSFSDKDTIVENNFIISDTLCVPKLDTKIIPANPWLENVSKEFKNKKNQNQNKRDSIFDTKENTSVLEEKKIKPIKDKRNNAIEKIDDKSKTPKRPYNFWLVSSLTIFFYLISYILKKLNIITTKTHRRIWNVVLLICFFICGILGIVLVVQINYRIFTEYILTLKKWHVPAGIVMVIVLFFHILWHLKYYIDIFKDIFVRNKNK